MASRSACLIHGEDIESELFDVGRDKLRSKEGGQSVAKPTSKSESCANTMGFAQAGQPTLLHISHGLFVITLAH